MKDVYWSWTDSKIIFLECVCVCVCVWVSVCECVCARIMYKWMNTYMIEYNLYFVSW